MEGHFLDKGVPNSIRSFSKDGIVTTSYSDDYIVRGRGFQIARRFTLSTGITKFALDPTGLTAENKQMFILPLSHKVTDGPVYIKTYKVDEYTGGTVVPSIDLNETVEDTAVVVFKQGVSSTGEAGDDLRDYIIGTSGGFLASGGGEERGDISIVNKPDRPYIIEVNNQSGGSVQYRIGIVWFELDINEIKG